MTWRSLPPFNVFYLEWAKEVITLQQNLTALLKRSQLNQFRGIILVSTAKAA